MAIQTAALLVLAQNYAGDIVRQFNRRSLLLSLLNKIEGEGKNVAWVAEGDGAAAAYVAEGAPAVTPTVDSQGSAILPWAIARSEFSVTDFAKSAARSSRTPEGNIALIARDMINASATLASKINLGLFTGASGQTPGQIVGLAEAIGLDNNTYATIDRGASAFWKPYVVDPGSATALTKAQIRLDLASIMKNGGVKPNFAFVGPSTLVALKAVLDPQIMYVVQSQQVMGANGLVNIEAGVSRVDVEGCTFVEDKDCPEGVIYYINTDAVHVEYLPYAQSFMNDDAMDSDATDGVEQIPLGMKVEALARVGSADLVMCESQIQLVVKRPNMCGTRKSVAYT